MILGTKQNRTVVFLAISSAFYFSYLPFLYMFDYFGLNKVVLFVVLILLTIFLLAIRLFTHNLQISRSAIVVFLLYQLFSMYAFIVFIASDNQLNDIFNIRTITIINSIFIVFSLSITNQKDLIIKATLVFSSLYLLLSANALLTGSIALSSRNFQNIAVGLDLDGGYYQNINIYLGLFVISSMYFMDTKSNILRFLIIGLILYSIFTAFIIGGRGGVVALALVGAFFIVNTIKNRFNNRTFILNALLYSVGFSILIFIFRHELSNFFQNSITFNRLTLLFEDNDSSQRIYLFTKAIELFLSDTKTFLFGAGTNSFPVYIGSSSLGMYPHNIVLELLAEYGLVGFSLFFSPILYIAYIRKKQLSSLYGNSSKERVIFLLVMYFWIISLFTGGLRSSWLLLFFTYFLLPSKSDQAIKMHKQRATPERFSATLQSGT